MSDVIVGGGGAESTKCYSIMYGLWLRGPAQNDRLGVDWRGAGVAAISDHVSKAISSRR